MPTLKWLLRRLWRPKVQPAADPSPVEAIVCLLRETKQQELHDDSA